MMPRPWVYDGEVNAAGKVLTLYSDGPSFTDPNAPLKNRDAIEIKSADHRVLTSAMLKDDGTWQQLMTSHYRRRK